MYENEVSVTGNGFKYPYIIEEKCLKMAPFGPRIEKKDIGAAKCQAYQVPFWYRFFVAENVLFCSIILLDILDKWGQIFIMRVKSSSLAFPHLKRRQCKVSGTVFIAGALDVVLEVYREKEHN